MTALTNGGRHGRARCVVLAGVQGTEIVDGRAARVDTAPDPREDGAHQRVAEGEPMTMRVRLTDVQPGAYRAMMGLEKYLADCPVPKRTLELIKLRASQMNGCTFCVDMHAHDLKADGETDERLFAVAAWRDAPWFTPAERAALALCEEATRLAPGGVGDEVWAEAERHYDQASLAALVTAIAAINAWNVVNVALRTTPGLLRGATSPAPA